MRYDFLAPSRISFGWGRLADAGAIARPLGRRALIVAGSRALVAAGAVDRLAGILRSAGIEAGHLHTIEREPRVVDVDRARALVPRRDGGSWV